MRAVPLHIRLESKMDPVTSFGVQVHAMLDGVTNEQMIEQLEAIASAGGRMVRTQLGWASFEEVAKGQWNSDRMAKLDLFVVTAQALSLEIVLVLADTPAWATSAPGGTAAEGWEKYLPTRLADFGEALAYLAGRYAGQVRAWEMWNEPNLDDFLKGAPAGTSQPRAAWRAARYAELVAAAYGLAKAAAPGATFIAGVLSECPVDFLELLYQTGIVAHCDAMSIHPYSHDASPTDERVADGYQQTSFAAGVPLIRAKMLEHNDPRPLWLTEVGWSTNTVRGNQDPGLNGVSEATQATYVRQLVEKTAEFPYVEAVIYYDLDDTVAQPSTFRLGQYGLRRLGGAAKLALAAFSEAVASFRS